MINNKCSYIVNWWPWAISHECKVQCMYSCSVVCDVYNSFMRKQHCNHMLLSVRYIILLQESGMRTRNGNDYYSVIGCIGDVVSIKQNLNGVNEMHG